MTSKMSNLETMETAQALARALHTELGLALLIDAALQEFCKSDDESMLSTTMDKLARSHKLSCQLFDAMRTQYPAGKKKRSRVVSIVSVPMEVATIPLPADVLTRAETTVGV